MQKLTLKALSARSGVSIGMLSQIEHGHANPSFVTLGKIATAMSLPLVAFLDGHPAPFQRIVRATARKRLSFPDRGITYELLTPDLSHQIELLYIEVAPGASTRERVFSHQGEEAGVVLRGSIEVHLEGKMSLLRVGDSITFPSHLAHWYRNPGKTKSGAIWAISPPSF
jgi:quercetin dioxygenase-like cupin family protein